MASDAPTSPVAETNAMATPSAIIDPVKAALICKAGIAKLFQQPTASMKAVPMAGGIIRVSYRRSSDNTFWKNDCRLEGAQIIWRAVDVTPGAGPGRWRDDPADGRVTYTMNGDEIVVEETF
ncbi:hypothetical protein [Novosphingobium sp. ZW T3_23]|uniref:hypothetical protein n=1 Tax=Novosphingobium sp. ZW T3_23 TaxID=3378084 RepID=UPI003854A38C